MTGTTLGPGEMQMTWLPDTCPSTSVRFPKAQEMPADRSGASLTTRLSCGRSKGIMLEEEPLGLGRPGLQAWPCHCPLAHSSPLASSIKRMLFPGDLLALTLNNYSSTARGVQGQWSLLLILLTFQSCPAAESTGGRGREGC